MNASQTILAGDKAPTAAQLHWQTLCGRADLVANSGVVAWLDGAQVALFYLPETAQGEQLFAIDNRDPKSGANVIGRGLIGQIAGELVIASPLYKQHFRLHDGSCIEYPEQRLDVWPVRLKGDQVEIAV
ncbi:MULTISPECIES: nitrite reductase small subunit NirD [Pseudomonas syringae group]|uniref:Nitrite reductase [NAD(P)H], small subunit n=4 Tax=Pseudomonas syringae group TaxID=136849 RepID=F3G8C7_PSESJ|nr:MULTISPECIES: nitrite reductase small subunit NirD [Pseudomonas syringae group]EGH43327.1 nitrite reductase [NAD(P)H], small subunit [Pseudomonas syringae pv. pisi str. 1704B]RMU71100.1 Nitrite reductase, small subunit [Pseudomonas syringae pv. aptata]PYD11104.1 nitrite reductase (NAD(P)H) small subunit [Pseudomonas syringae pv. pisi]PYD28561.1 nitrite reductase (NAD(P)H) small subunit [Pseudomonas syringae pv. pisi]PYD29988.1 nitrite reductase (NAD(P)H) small subunit [Pseudomonas syringae 